MKIMIIMTYILYYAWNEFLAIVNCLPNRFYMKIVEYMKKTIYTELLQKALKIVLQLGSLHDFKKSA